MSKQILSDFERNVFRAFKDCDISSTLRHLRHMDIIVDKVYRLLNQRKQLPNPITHEYIEKILQHFIDIGMITWGSY